MYFKRLELVGFKSFSEKTILNFEPGITAVVGPNGCGKSNIFDSIRWVLGEQSAKSLRGSDMQDVIFNGTDKKEAVGMAEVSLAFDNSQRFFNLDNDEMMVTRRLFRSGESEYLLNKTPVRLKDILDLLLGTGVGAESYSIVAQGKIDLVLSSKPEDRRLVFDEASGITKYKSQKRETMRKLEETQQYLLRVNDIIAEVKRQISSLERQANKARKYKEVFEELKSKEITLSFLQKADLLKEKERISVELTSFGLQESELINTVKELEAKISNRQEELRILEEGMMEAKNKLLNLENSAVRNSQHIKFNQDRIAELIATKKYLEEQTEKAKSKLAMDEDKLKAIKEEYNSIKENIESKTLAFTEKEARLNNLALSIKNSLDIISQRKKSILDFTAKIANAKNEISDFKAKQQVFLARKKRLDIEKAKVYEEGSVVEESLNNIIQAVDSLKKEIENINVRISGLKSNIDKENLSLNDVNAQIASLENQRLTLESHKEFLEKLRTEYDEIGESMNAVIYLDRPPKDNVSGLVIKINNHISMTDEDRASVLSTNFKLSGEAKPIELNTENIEKKILQLKENIELLKIKKTGNESQIEEFNKYIQIAQQELRNKEIALANSETSRLTILEQFNKIKEEEDVIVMELHDVGRELSVIDANLVNCQSLLSGINTGLESTEGSILDEENNISENSKLREDILVGITQIKTELNALNNRIASDEATIRILQGTYEQDSASLKNLDKQLSEAQNKEETLGLEIKDCEFKIQEAKEEIQKQNILLAGLEAKYKEILEGTSDVVNKIDAGRNAVDGLKSKIHELQIHEKDVDYKYSSMKDRLLQAYKVDLEGLEETAQVTDALSLSGEIEKLKDRLDSYGTVNLVAIEEYDELKKRYDFLIQQEGDLLKAKESLHQAILKINRTTKQMFLETFEKVKEEFRNYFRLLFNGGDAQLFLIDEQDPLESGIEIICRPPGKKLQNVLLLSGGEKSMSAIALIFSIFKVKPSPFCILDEIDAALDEANVDRFSKVLQEFAKTSQFIVITHNKRTIANADVMYGITMEESGVSKIVSVKFGKSQPQKHQDKTPDVDKVSEAV